MAEKVSMVCELTIMLTHMLSFYLVTTYSQFPFNVEVISTFHNMRTRNAVMTRTNLRHLTFHIFAKGVGI
jgi:hypothetical protein